MNMRRVIAFAITAVVAALGVGALAMNSASAEPPDAAMVRVHAGQFMKNAGTVHALRVNGPVAHGLLFASGEGPVSDARFANGHQLTVIRIDGDVDMTAVPAPPDSKIPAQSAAVIVSDPATGNIVSVVTIGAGDDKQSARLDLAKLGSPAAVAVGTGDLLRTKVAKAEANS